MNKYKFNIDETVYVTSTGHTGVVTSRITSSTGHNVYYLDTNEVYENNYPFFQEDLSSIDKELEESQYNAYLDSLEAKYLNESEKKDALEQKFKFDKGKIRHSLMNPDFIEEVLKVLEFGANKYEEGSWNEVAEHRYADALYRHYMEYLKGGVIDVESTYSHMAHIVANAMFIYSKIEQEGRND